MPTISSIRFQKYDKYDNAIFIANSEREPKAFKKLKGYYSQLKLKFPDVFLPIYSSDEHQYSTVRFRKSKFTRKLEANDVYAVEFAIKKRNRDGKMYVNCFLDDIDLISKAVPMDYGEDVDLSDSDFD